MKTLRSYVAGNWHEARSGFVPLVNPSTEEVIGQASSRGVDIAATLEIATRQAGPILRDLSFAERGDLLKAMSKELREYRQELLELSCVNNGTTAADGAFDIDGASGTLAYYAGLARQLGERDRLAAGEGVQLSRSEAFWGQHVWVPKQGVAIHINAFNFPAWGFAEKAACALLAGMPVITKPATATALVAERCVEIITDADILPPGALQLICGSTGELLDRLGPQDVVAFTGSAETARYLRCNDHLNAVNVRFNTEADSLNAAVLGPDVVSDSDTMRLFVEDVTREMTQKAGQKCTAVRRILVPAARLGEVGEILSAKLAQVVTGNPSDEAVTMGPLATAAQLQDTLNGIAELRRETELVWGDGLRAEGVGSPAGKGFFVAPTLLQAGDARAVSAVHRREVFAPVATLLPYDGTPSEAAELAALAAGTLVTSVYGDDGDWLDHFVRTAGSSTGRIYVGSQASSNAAPGSGVALPQTLHGGPGRAGGGEELGGLIGVELYMQRLALQGSRPLVDRLARTSQRSS
jgi:oxepin-CoA hydrolase/3-oxo-5,6-dehydrosuberyl-CoA semialdehyde dehydrogenase